MKTVLSELQSGFLQALWSDFIQINPQAMEIHRLLKGEGELIENDHIAIRAFGVPSVDVDALSQVFLRMGYSEKGNYEFKQKKLRASHFEREENDPKIFISELLVDECSSRLQEIVAKLLQSIPKGFDFSLLENPRPWSLSYSTYEELLEESEYAAWMAAFGFRANHFTISVNRLQKFSEVGQLNRFLKNHGFRLNASGGEVKGSPEEYLEQSSTLASPVDVVFSDGTYSIPGCYYEFAKRYPQSNGKVFNGFVTQSADKIFESTDAQPRV